MSVEVRNEPRFGSLASDRLAGGLPPNTRSLRALAAGSQVESSGQLRAEWRAFLLQRYQQRRHHLPTQGDGGRCPELAKALGLPVVRNMGVHRRGLARRKRGARRQRRGRDQERPSTSNLGIRSTIGPPTTTGTAGSSASTTRWQKLESSVSRSRSWSSPTTGGTSAEWTSTSHGTARPRTTSFTLLQR